MLVVTVRVLIVDEVINSGHLHVRNEPSLKAVRASFSPSTSLSQESSLICR